MSKIQSIYKGFYDPVTKIWSGPNWHRLYDRNCSIGRILYEEMRRRPKEIRQISDSEQIQLTNEEVLQQAFRIVKYFETLELKQSDIVGLVCRNTAYLLGVILGCFFSGIAPHAISRNHDEKTMRYLFNITKPKLIFCDGREYAKVSAATTDLDCTIITLRHRVVDVPHVQDILNDSRYEPESDSEPVDLENGRDQTLVILCSSGTTGLPKAVTISNNTRGYIFGSELTSSDVVYMNSTFDWVTSLLIIITSIVHGSRLIITDKSYSPEYFVELTEKYGITFTLLSRAFMVMLATSSELSAEKLKSLKYFIVGGGKCSITLMRKIQSYLSNGNVIPAYGFTEFGNPITLNYNLNKADSVGQLRPSYKLKIIDKAGECVGPGELGEICCNHGEHWLGYYNNREATDATFDSGRWYHSGDIGYMDEQMFLYIVDRKKDILKYRSLQYWPSEIETTIAELNDVVDVSVFGVYNDLDGDAAAAAVVLVEGSTLCEQDIVDYVASKFEVKYKHLNAGAVIVKDLPKSINGKVDRKALQALFEKLN